ncbi:MAG TPA: DNA polymerase III subunit delta' [Vicinamibacterales bacterium]|jgi:DNA polymerase-3 subunit delta'
MPFSSVVGHRPVLELLARAVARQMLPQSLIFAGPAGIGKRRTALALAQALNCDSPIAIAASATVAAGMDACGACVPCTRIARGVHADILVVEPGDSGTIKVDQVREAIDRAMYRPFEGRRRIVTIEDADALLAEAQNALLKTLEEPPPASVFVLITSRPDLLLPTVRSRCQRLRFGPLHPADVAAVLVRDHGFDAADARAAAAASDGSVGRALTDGAADALEDRDAAAQLLGAAATPDPRRRLDAAKAFAGSAADRDELSRRLRAVSSLLRDLGLIAVRGAEHILANADVRPQLQSLARAYDARRAVEAFAVVDRAVDALDRNASPKIVADWVALHL